MMLTLFLFFLLFLLFFEPGIHRPFMDHGTVGDPNERKFIFAVELFYRPA